MQSDFRQIPITQLVFSQTTAQKERRAHFQKVGLTELAASIKAVGIAQPILVRPKFKEDHGKMNQFEVCAGERRVLAAKEVGLAEVPAMVREMSDEQLLELQLIENLQREGLHELAEAEGYEQLMKLGMSVEQIVAKVGKSRAYVYGRLKLTDCCKEVRAAFYAGEIAASTALELARIPVEDLQKKALKEITKPKWGNGPVMSVREAREHIQKEYMLRLSAAGFPTDDADLVKKAGTCNACPKRTGNQPELFGDVKGTDICTDPVCFKAKIVAFGTRAIAEAKEKGQKVIVGKEAEKIAPHGVDRWLEGYVELSAISYEHNNKTYGQVLGKDYVPTLLQDPESGKLVKVAPKKDIPAPKRAKSSGSKSGGSSGVNLAAEKAKREKEERYRRELLKLIYQKAPAAPNKDLLVMVCSDAAFDSDEDVVNSLLKDLGIPEIPEGRYYEKAFAKLSVGILGRLAYVLKLESGTPSAGHGEAKELENAAKSLKIDTKKVRAQLAAAAVAADSGPKAAPTKKKKAKAPARKK